MHCQDEPLLNSAFCSSLLQSISSHSAHGWVEELSAEESGFLSLLGVALLLCRDYKYLQLIIQRCLQHGFLSD